MRVVLPYHLGSGNRGCEGIARGISKIFKLSKKELVLYDISSYDYESDCRLGLENIGELRYKGSFKDESVRFASRVLKRLGNQTPYMRFLCDYYLNDVTPEDTVFITGGDIYCYEGQHVLPNMIAKKTKTKGAQAVLYGVSMEDRLLTQEVIDGLRQYDTIITRESISAETLERKGLPNVLYPDPAFSLEPQQCILPDYFEKNDVVGINFSTFTDRSGLFKENIINLINYILSNGMVVCLIPHVFWKGQDDRRSIQDVLQSFQGNVYLLDSEKLSYPQIRYVISKCKYFVGGRTHSIISAYSTCTPCIALGYSVKARGLVKDLGLPTYTLVDSNHLDSPRRLLDSFKKLEEHRDEIMDAYSSVDSYKANSLQASSAINLR